MMEQPAIIYGKEDVASERKYKLERLKRKVKIIWKYKERLSVFPHN